MNIKSICGDEKMIIGWEKKQREKEFENIFDEKKEYKIYKYLCGKKIRNWKGILSRKCCIVEENELFHTYKEWEEHVWQKYKGLNNDQMREFQKFLNQKKRVESQVTKTKLIISTALFTLVLTNGASDFLKSSLNSQQILIIGIMLLIAGFISGVALIGVIWGLDYVMFNARLKELFYEDYMEILMRKSDTTSKI